MLFFYILIIRPQTKRAKDQADMVSSLKIGDEVLTTGGVVGKIKKLRDRYLIIQVSDDCHLTIQAASVHAVLPHGTTDNI